MMLVGWGGSGEGKAKREDRGRQHRHRHLVLVQHLDGTRREGERQAVLQECREWEWEWDSDPGQWGWGSDWPVRVRMTRACGRSRANETTSSKQPRTVSTRTSSKEIQYVQHSIF